MYFIYVVVSPACVKFNIKNSFAVTVNTIGVYIYYTYTEGCDVIYIKKEEEKKIHTLGVHFGDDGLKFTHT